VSPIFYKIFLAGYTTALDPPGDHLWRVHGGGWFNRSYRNYLHIIPAFKDPDS
jgi:hypothetical protein